VLKDHKELPDRKDQQGQLESESVECKDRPDHKELQDHRGRAEQVLKDHKE
jgi:hypothetical protein